METTGALNPPWKVGKQGGSTFLTYIDFETEESAERAMEALNDKVIEGRRVQLKPLTVGPQKAKQIGKVDKSLLAQLQQHGLLSTEESSAKAVV
mgnify:CR=1 FL=1